MSEIQKDLPIVDAYAPERAGCTRQGIDQRLRLGNGADQNLRMGRAAGDFAQASRQDHAGWEFLMTKFFVAVCCMLLAGCAATGMSAGVDPMQSDGSTYVPSNGAATYAPSADERPTSTCTMRGQSAVCR